MLNVENNKEHLNALNPKVGEKYKKLLEETENERGESINDLIGLLIKSLIIRGSWGEEPRFLRWGTQVPKVRNPGS